LITLILHWFAVAADGYYSGRPLGYDPQQAQAEAVPPAPRQAIAGEQANGVPAPQRQPRQDVGEQVPNHTHVHGVPGVCHTDPNFFLSLSLQATRLAFFFLFFFWRILFDVSSVCL